uniref:Uncharacterized protein n=1 Tax=Glossina palpalis gambiensis TaxID=67801 RepID=A0A1B0C015_9MUSC
MFREEMRLKQLSNHYICHQEESNKNCNPLCWRNIIFLTALEKFLLNILQHGIIASCYRPLVAGLKDSQASEKEAFLKQ